MEIDWWTLVLQTINFLIVVWLLSRFLYRPVRRIIEEREAADRRAAEDASAKAEAAVAARQDYEKKLAALDEGDRQRDAAFHTRLEKERASILSDAQVKAEQQLSEARELVKQESADALKGLRKDIVELAAGLARKALSDMPATAEAEIAHVARYFDDLPESERRELRKDLEGDGAEVTLVSAADLPEPVCKMWRDMLGERFGKPLHLAFRSDPSLLGGLKVRFPHAVLDFSVAGRLDRAAAAVGE